MKDCVCSLCKKYTSCHIIKVPTGKIDQLCESCRRMVLAFMDVIRDETKRQGSNRIKLNLKEVGIKARNKLRKTWAN